MIELVGVSRTFDMGGRPVHALVEVSETIQGGVDRLPKPDSIWPLDDRAKWLRTAVSIFDLVYEPGQGEERGISVGLVKLDA